VSSPPKKSAPASSRRLVERVHREPGPVHRVSRGDLHAAVGLLHAPLGHQGRLRNLQSPIGEAVQADVPRVRVLRIKSVSSGFQCSVKLNAPVRAVRSTTGRSRYAPQNHFDRSSPLLRSDRFRPKPVVAVKRRFKKSGLGRRNCADHGHLSENPTCGELIGNYSDGGRYPRLKAWAIGSDNSQREGELSAKRSIAMALRGARPRACV
jgi:hypothetical protein